MKLRITESKVRYVAGRMKTVYVLEQLSKEGYWYEIGRYGYLEEAEKRKYELENTKGYGNKKM